MKERIAKKFAKVSVGACDKMAKSVSASACTWMAYQPKEPKCLKK